MSDSVSLTDRAVEKARELMSRGGLSSRGLRATAVRGSCSGLESEVGFAPHPADGDAGIP